MAVIEWPQRLVKGLSSRAYPVAVNRSAGVGLNGVESVVATGTHVWRVELSLPKQLTRLDVQEFEALVVQMHGRANIARIPLCDPYGYNNSFSPLQYPFNTGEPGAQDYWLKTPGNDNEYGFATSGTETQELVTTGARTIGENLIYVNLDTPRRPRMVIGQIFSIDDFLYMVVSANGQGGIEFEPSLRTDVPLGTQIDTAPPYFKGRFAADDTGMRSRMYHRWGENGSLSLVEAFER